MNKARIRNYLVVMPKYIGGFVVLKRDLKQVLLALKYQNNSLDFSMNKVL